MTALALDVRELSFEEMDAVSGGCLRCVIAAARWVANAVASGMAYEAAVAAWEYLQENPPESDNRPRPVSYGV